MKKHHSGSEWELKWWEGGSEKWGCRPEMEKEWTGEMRVDRRKMSRSEWETEKENSLWASTESELGSWASSALVQIGASTRSKLGSFCAWSGSELDSSSAWSGSKLVCGSELVSSSGLELVSSSAWSGSELASSTVWSGSELGSFEVRRCGVDRSLAASSLDRGASVWIVPFGSVCGSEQLSFERGNACLREECVWERGGKRLKWKYGLKLISVAFGLIYGQTENIFSLTEFTVPIKYVIFRKMISEFRFQPKQTDH